MWHVYLLLVFLSAVMATICPSSHPKMGLVEMQSMSHVGDGKYLVLACCPINTHAEFFGMEGVGCCKNQPGQRCIFTCKCKDGSLPTKSVVPNKSAFPQVYT